VSAYCAEDRSAILAQITHRLNAPPTSSMGRFFDAAAALLGVRQTATYEGQPAIELEALVDPQEAESYDFEISGEIIQPALLWQALISDWRAALPLPRLAARFHNSISHLVLQLSQQLRSETGCGIVALSGGVWQNRVLLEQTLHLLQTNHFRVLLHRQTPANDGCIALGQALVAAHTLTKLS